MMEVRNSCKNHRKRDFYVATKKHLGICTKLFYSYVVKFILKYYKQTKSISNVGGVKDSIFTIQRTNSVFLQFSIFV